MPEYENLVQTCNIGRRHFVAILTRGHSFDREALAQALSSHAQYVGMPDGLAYTLLVDTNDFVMESIKEVVSTLVEAMDAPAGKTE